MSKKIKGGDQIVFGNCKTNKRDVFCAMSGITIGRIYDVRNEYGDAEFIDDDGDVRIVAHFKGEAKITKIVS